MTPSALLALAMTCAPTVHPDTAHDVARVESGLNPFAIAEIIPREKRTPGDKGVISYFPDSIKTALNITRQIELRKHRYSVGLMQITSSNFSKYNMNAEKLFSPCNNLSVFEKIITDCYLRGGNLVNALSCYYSGNFTTGKKSEPEFSDTSYTGRIGYTETTEKKYVVPSTKTDRKSITSPSPDSDKPRQIWPGTVVRGAVSDSFKSRADSSRTVYPAEVMRGKLTSTNIQAKVINNETD